MNSLLMQLFPGFLLFCVVVLVLIVLPLLRKERDQGEAISDERQAPEEEAMIGHGRSTHPMRISRDL